MKEYIKLKYNPTIFYILSAKYGIISSKTKIENYNVSFFDKTKCITIEQIKEQLVEELKTTTEIIFIGGKLYTSILSQIFETIHTPIPSLSIGYMMQYLKKEINILKNKSKNNLFNF